MQSSQTPLPLLLENTCSPAPAAARVTYLRSPRPVLERPLMAGCSSYDEALGNKVIHPYSDFLLHDIETGDGIVQAGPQDTANKLPTAPLWGLRMRPRFMHDLKSLTLQDAN